MSDLPSAALGVLADLAAAADSSASGNPNANAFIHSLDATPCRLLSALPSDVYNTDRDAAGRLDSAPIRLCIQLSAAARAAFAAEARAYVGDSAARAAFAALVHVEVLLADGTCPMVYWDGSMTPVQAPSVEFGELACDALILHLRRELPLSSSHGGSPMRLAFCVGAEVFVSAPFVVHSKRSKTVPKAKRARPVAAPSARRQRLLDDMCATAAAAPRPAKMHKVL